MANDEARELFQTFSLLGSRMGEGYRQARKEEEEERRKARREQLLLSIFGPSIAEGVTSLIKAPFEEPVNKFLATESTNIFDDEGNIIGQNRGGLDVKRFKSDVLRADQTISSIQKAAERGGSSVQDYFANSGISNLGGGIKNIVGELDYKVHGSFNGPNIDTTGKRLGELDYDEYKELVAWRSKFGTVEEIDALIAEQNPVPKSFMQAAYKAAKRLLRRETKDTVRERSVRNLEEILGVELTAEGHQSFMDLVDRAARVGNVYDIPVEVERLISHPKNIGFKEIVTLRRGEAQARTQQHIADRQFIDAARGGEYGKAAEKYVAAAMRNDERPSFDGYVEVLRQDINLPEWNDTNKSLFASVMSNDDSVRAPLETLRDAISQNRFEDETYQDLIDGGYEDSVAWVDSQLDKTLKSVFSAAQMLSTRQIGAKLDEPEDVQMLEGLGLLDPDSLKGHGLVLSNMRAILKNRMSTEQFKTGWWFWSGTDERYTGGIDFPKLLEENFTSGKLNSVTGDLRKQAPSEEDRVQKEISSFVGSWQIEMDRGKMTTEEMLGLVNAGEANFNAQGINVEKYRITRPMLRWRNELEDPRTELPAAKVEQYYARFITGDPNLDVETDIPDAKIKYLAGDAREKLTKDLKSEWYDIGRPLYEERKSRQGDIQWENVKGWFQGRSRAERLAFEKEVADAGGSILDLHQETFWNAKDVDIIAPLIHTNKGYIPDHDVSSIADWFIKNPQHLESLAENNYNLIEFVLRQQSEKK